MTGYPHGGGEFEVEVELYLTPYQKKKKMLRWIAGLNIKVKTISLRRKYRVYIYDLGFDNDFLNMTPIVTAKIRKNNKVDFVKINYIFSSKNTIKKVKKLSTVWEKMIAKYPSIYVSINQYQ